MDQLHAFHKTRNGYIVLVLVELALLYIVASIAIDTANMFAYFAGVALIIGIILNSKNAITAHPKK